MKLPALFLSVALPILLTAQATGAVIGVPSPVTFGETLRDIGDMGPNSENGVQYEGFGSSWNLQTTYSQGGAALSTFWGIPSATGNKMVFNLLDGGQFVFQSFDIAGRMSGADRNDVVMARGFLDGNEVASQQLDSATTLWVQRNPDAAFAAPIDTLEFEVVTTNGSALFFDNLVLAPVPEPSMTGLLIASGACLLARRQRERTSKG